MDLVFVATGGGCLCHAMVQHKHNVLQPECSCASLQWMRTCLRKGLLSVTHCVWVAGPGVLCWPVLPGRRPSPWEEIVLSQPFAGRFGRSLGQIEAHGPVHMLAAKVERFLVMLGHNHAMMGHDYRYSRNIPDVVGDAACWTSGHGANNLRLRAHWLPGPPGPVARSA